ncbi:MAG: hypothetical protein ACHQSE_10355 [Gemmatimonadales bacterium]
MRRFIVPVLALALGTAAFARPVALRWPPWLSIESPVNPFDRESRGAVFLVHATIRDGVPVLADLSGSAEGVVNGSRRSMPVHFDTTSRPGVFAVRKQWPSDGTWLLRVSFHATTAIVVLGRDGDVVSVRVPTQLQGGSEIPRAVAAREIDSTLAAAARR